MLGECYVLSGADTDGNPPESVHVWPGAVEAVRELREDYDEVCEEAHGPDGFVKQIDTLTAERDRLARILAVERGDESQAPDGWTRMEHVSGWAARDRHGRGWTVRYDRLGDGWHTASVYLDGIRVYSDRLTALEAMEAADAAREGSDV